VHLYIDDRFLFLDFENNQEIILLKEAFTYEDASSAFRGGSFDKRKIKKVSFLKKKGKYYFLFSGFLKDLLLKCKENNIKINEVKDKRTKFSHQERNFSYEEIKSYLPDFDYVEHQINALKCLLKKNNGIIKATTASGKTDTFIAFIKITQLPTLIIVNRITLASQIAARLEKAGVKDIGLFHSKSNKKGRITVSTIGSIKKIPNLDEFKVLILDETHRIQSNSYQEFLKNTSYPLRFGFSATPFSGDNYKWALIKQFIGDIIYEIKAKELIENNVIAKPEIELLHVQCPPTIDWYMANQKCIIENKQRNAKIIDLVKQHNTPTLILIRNIEHGELLEDSIPGSQFVSGIDDNDIREDVIKRFEEGSLKVIISSNIFNEGISIDNIQLLIIASGGKSRIETTQKIGRSLRSMGGKKKKVFVYDFYDAGNKFTEKHSLMRKRTYIREGFEVK
jgi:superfamily II DNA or RNA helicase